MTTAPLANARCAHHRDREAAARCPSCGKFFCRECITEHAGRVLCSTCLVAQAGGSKPRRSFLRPAWVALQLLAGFLAAFAFFYFCAQILVLIPDSMHKGTIWKVGK